MGCTHPVNLLRFFLAILIPTGYVAPSLISRQLEDEPQCTGLVDTIDELGLVVVKLALLFLVGDVLGCIAFASKSRTFRWWGQYEKTVTRCVIFALWVLSCTAMFSYMRGIYATHFKCWSAEVVMVLLVLLTCIAVCPLYLLLVVLDDSRGGRYIPQEDVEDQLEESLENPRSYQVWRNGKLVLASLSRTEVRRWVATHLSEADYENTVVREIQL